MLESGEKDSRNRTKTEIILPGQNLFGECLAQNVQPKPSKFSEELISTEMEFETDKINPLSAVNIPVVFES